MSTTKRATEETIRNLCLTAMIYRGMTANLDTLKTEGIWWTNVDTVCADPPSWMASYWRYAIVEVMQRSGIVFQRLTGQKGMAYRFIRSDGTASAWMKICEPSA